MANQPQILVCTDFSPFSDVALKAADIIRTRMNGHLYVLHVSEHPVLWDWVPKEGAGRLMDETFEKELMDRLSKKLNSQMESCGVKGEAYVSTGLPANIIIQEILGKKIDLIVIGHKGRTGGTFHVGSLAEKIVASSPIPVLVAKGPLKTNKLGVLVDPNSPMEKLIKAAEDLSSQCSSQLLVVALFPDIGARYVGMGKLGFSTKLLSLGQEQKNEIISTIKEGIREITTRPETQVHVEISVERKLAYHLNSILSEGKVELAIMQRHQSEFLEKVLIGSETRRMLELFAGNLLVLPP